MRRPAAEEPCPDVLSGHCCFLGQNTKNHLIPSTVAKAARNLSLLVFGFPAYLFSSVPKLRYRQGAGSGRWESFERMVEVLNASVSIQQLADRMSAKGSSAAGRRIGAGCVSYKERNPKHLELIHSGADSHLPLPAPCHPFLILQFFTNLLVIITKMFYYRNKWCNMIQSG